MKLRPLLAAKKRKKAPLGQIEFLGEKYGTLKGIVSLNRKQVWSE